MIKKIIKIFSWKADGNKELHTPKNLEVSFDLLYKELRVGKLSLKDGKWKYQYSEYYKKQTELQTLVDFPDKNKTYEAEDLWPFFASRIPSLSQPSVQEVIRIHNIDKNNSAELLKQFGKQTITNPFLLIPDFSH